MLFGRWLLCWGRPGPQRCPWNTAMTETGPLRESDSTVWKADFKWKHPAQASGATPWFAGISTKPHPFWARIGAAGPLKMPLRDCRLPWPKSVRCASLRSMTKISPLRESEKDPESGPCPWVGSQKNPTERKYHNAHITKIIVNNLLREYASIWYHNHYDDFY